MLLNAPRAAALMKDRGLDGLLGSTLQNVFYLSGFWNENFSVVPHTTQTYALVVRGELAVPSVVAGLGDVAAVVDACAAGTKATYFGTVYRYTAPGVPLNAVEQAVADRLAAGDAKPSALEGLVAALAERGLTRGVLGYDERGMGPGVVDGLRSRLPGLELRPAEEVFRTIRAVKTEEEVRRLSAAVALTENAIRAAMAIAEPGVTEEEMIREFDKTIVMGSGRPIFSQIYFGRRGATGQHPFVDGVLQKGDVVRFDVGCLLAGYCSDIARNYSMGEPSEEIRRLHAATVAAEDAALAALKPEVAASEVFRLAVEAARDAGIPDYKRHHVGHSVGLDVYDGILLAPHDRTVVEAGMTFEVETPYYEIGTGGVQPEDTVVVTESGIRMLSTMPRELVIIA